MSYKAWMTFKDEPPATNSLAFATKEEAEAYGSDLYGRWTIPTGYEVRESDEPVNYRWVDGEGLQRLGSDRPPEMPPARVQL